MATHIFQAGIPLPSRKDAMPINAHSTRRKPDGRRAVKRYGFQLPENGSSFDITDAAGEGFDIFWHAPHHWYKGVNDYKNQVKYFSLL